MTVRVRIALTLLATLTTLIAIMWRSLSPEALAEMHRLYDAVLSMRAALPCLLPNRAVLASFALSDLLSVRQTRSDAIIWPKPTIGPCDSTFLDLTLPLVVLVAEPARQGKSQIFPKAPITFLGGQLITTDGCANSRACTSRQALSARFSRGAHRIRGHRRLPAIVLPNDMVMPRGAGRSPGACAAPAPFPDPFPSRAASLAWHRPHPLYA